MSGLTVTYLMGASACLTLGTVYLVARLRNRTRRAHLSSDSHEPQQQMELAATAAELESSRWDSRRDDVWVSDKGRALLGLNGTPKISLSDFLNSLPPEDRLIVGQSMRSALP